MQYSGERVAGGQSPEKRAKFEVDGLLAGRLGEDRQSLHGLLDSLALLDSRMRMLVRRDGTLLAGCSKATDLLDHGTCLRVRSGRVVASQPDYDEKFRELLQTRHPAVSTLALPCWMIEGHVIVRATSVCKDVVCLGLQSATEMVEPELADLTEVFGLTAAESSIVYNLYLGHTPKQIAKSHDNSIHTIRAHIRRCYDKLGITCREELWRKLNAYRLL